jgi:NADH-quinone oxidoreductase subunit C
MSRLTTLVSALQSAFPTEQTRIVLDRNEVTMEVKSQSIVFVCQKLRDDPAFRFEMLMDLCGIDYLQYGCSEWETTLATSRGFERAVTPITKLMENSTWTRPRLAVVYHLLSVKHNLRLRLKAFVADEEPIIDSVVGIWNSANWYEREAFDLYGILFANHPDLRRLLTDYGFVGHPFRKDFPLVGNVEVRFDAEQNRVIYEPVDIVPRTLVPKVIRAAKEGTEHG